MVWIGGDLNLRLDGNPPKPPNHQSKSAFPREAEGTAQCIFVLLRAYRRPLLRLEGLGLAAGGRKHLCGPAVSEGRQQPHPGDPLPQL